MIRFLFLIFGALSAHASKNNGVALIYQGPGSCLEEDSDCTQAAAQVARLAGFTPRLIKHDRTDVKKIFSKAKVWIQPGGVSNEAYNSMSDELIEGIKSFVKGGGGYVGFCAGGFMATQWIGGTRGIGFGFISGGTGLYHKGWSLPPVLWNGTIRHIWFEGGPYFYGFQHDPSVEVTATYETGAAAAIRAPYGEGRVWVTGLHPEAPANWATDDGVVDPDGSEQHLAAEMVQWAAKVADRNSAKKPAAKKKLQHPTLRLR
jgi:glutamine amidotransferase-like uncharacterized protein